LTLLLYHRQSQKSIVLGKINKIIIFAKALDKLLEIWYNGNSGHCGSDRRAEKAPNKGA
jgi:hypothetical protein